MHGTGSGTGSGSGGGGDCILRGGGGGGIGIGIDIGIGINIDIGIGGPENCDVKYIYNATLVSWPIFIPIFFHTFSNETEMSVSLSGISSSSSVSVNGTTGVAGSLTSLGISTSVNESVVIGYGGAVNQQGINNLFAGYEVAAQSTTGNNNVAMGYQAAEKIAGDGNVIIGSASGKKFTFANGNVAIGVGAARDIQSAFSNVLIGAGTNSTATNASGAIAIGANARAAGGNGNATIAAVAMGNGSTADGRYALALGTGTYANGDGAFTLANRVRGYHSVADPGSYVVQVDADALKIANGGVLAFTPRTLTATSSAASTTPLDQAAAWRAGMEGDDLVFRSVGGAVVRFTDDYVSGVLDFVASHSSEWSSSSSGHKQAMLENEIAGRNPLAYLIVSSAADEAGLVSSPSSSVPRVRVCASVDDCRAAFGVVAPSLDRRGSHRIGHVAFDRASVFDRTGGALGDRVADRTGGTGGTGAGSADGGALSDSVAVTVYSLGEGWIWVGLDAGGCVRNGDLLVAVPGCGGVAAVSTSPFVMNTTVAKATMTVRASVSASAVLVPCTYRF